MSSIRRVELRLVFLRLVLLALYFLRLFESEFLLIVANCTY